VLRGRAGSSTSMRYGRRNPALSGGHLTFSPRMNHSRQGSSIAIFRSVIAHTLAHRSGGWMPEAFRRSAIGCEAASICCYRLTPTGCKVAHPETVSRFRGKPVGNRVGDLACYNGFVFERNTELRRTTNNLRGEHKHRTFKSIMARNEFDSYQHAARLPLRFRPARRVPACATFTINVLGV